MTPQVKQMDGLWCVVREGEVLAHFGSNSAAWRWLNKYQGVLLSPKEKTHAWSWNQYARSYP